MIKVKNISDSEQCFTDMPVFLAGEVREVSKEEAEYLSRSPFIEILDQEEKKQSKKSK